MLGEEMTQSNRQKNWVYLNDRLVPEQEAMISVYDRGFLYGDGIFETLRAYRGKIFKVKEHLSRLFESAKAVALTIPNSPGEILRMLLATLNANQLRDARLRITLSRGTDKMGFDPRNSLSPTLVVTAKAYSGQPEKLYQEGVEISLVKTQKVSAAALDPKIKSLNYLNSILARFEAQGSGTFEGILLNQDKYLCEGTVSNLFFVKGGELLTPSSSCGILEGITRQTVIQLATQTGISVKEGKYSPDAILAAEECFLTSTLMELMPAVRIRDLMTEQEARSIGEGKVGSTTNHLLKSYRKAVREAENEHNID
jgi:branched-chain amino acid aminotransferase